MVNFNSFLKRMMNGGSVVEPFSRVMGGGKRRSVKKSKKSVKRKKTKTKMKKNLSRKKATKRKIISKKRSLRKNPLKIKRKTIKKNRKTTKKKRVCNCDIDRFYQGNEPSPKGLGFCAHCTPLNVTMKGLDGNLWENKKFSKGKRWIKARVN
jgi:hypothetical protein